MTAVDKVMSKECDECGKSVEKIWRVYKDHRYCSTCYAREFKRKLCPKCGNFAKLPRRMSEAICDTCEKAKPCARCGKSEYVIGAITPYGPVCNACSTYFRKIENCEVCGANSNKLTRVSRLGHDKRVCQKCARVDHGTCKACQRHRLLYDSMDGQKICKKCFDHGEISCSNCSALMPAGYGTQCQQCYWTQLYSKRLEMDVVAFSGAEMAEHFRTYGRWLCNSIGEHKAALTIHKYLVFFIAIEQEWKSIPTYEVLLKHFGAARLRKVLLPMRWLEESGNVILDSVMREDDSEKRRIVAALNKLPNGSKLASLLEGYHKKLRNDLAKGLTSIRSCRLALSPAVSLLQKTNENGSPIPDQRALGDYLDISPGQRAAISGFIGYLGKEHGIELNLPKADNKRAQENRRKKLELEILEIMRQYSGEEKSKEKWISVALAYFHGLPRRIGRNLNKNDVIERADGFNITWKEVQYWLPNPTSFRLKGMR